MASNPGRVPRSVVGFLYAVPNAQKSRSADTAPARRSSRLSGPKDHSRDQRGFSTMTKEPLCLHARTTLAVNRARAAELAKSAARSPFGFACDQFLHVGAINAHHTRPSRIQLSTSRCTFGSSRSKHRPPRMSKGGAVRSPTSLKAPLTRAQPAHSSRKNRPSGRFLARRRR